MGAKKHAGGRPPKLTPKQKAEVLQAFQDYIRREADPTIVGFVAYDPTPIKYNVTDDNISDWDEFSGLRKRAIKKQEAYLLLGATRGQLNTTMAIFRLKQPQHGYSDKTEIKHEGAPGLFGAEGLTIKVINGTPDEGSNS